MKYVVIINGKPRAGKTTFQRKCKFYLDIEDNFRYHSVSSIDYIKEIYRQQLGWNGIKTDKARKDLSILKKMWIDNCNGPLAHILKFVLSLPDEEDHMVFVDVREESEIIKYVDTFDALKCINIRYTTVFIDRDDTDAIEYGNKSDDGVGKNMSLYMHIIHNDGDIINLEESAKAFIKEVTKDLNMEV